MLLPKYKPQSTRHTHARGVSFIIKWQSGTFRSPAPSLYRQTSDSLNVQLFLYYANNVWNFGCLSGRRSNAQALGPGHPTLTLHNLGFKIFYCLHLGVGCGNEPGFMSQSVSCINPLQPSNGLSGQRAAA